MIVREIHRLRLAIGLMTRLPTGSMPAFESQELERAAKYFPLAGALVGVLGGGAAITAAIFLPHPLYVVAGLLVAMLASGALHEDGLADAADGLLGGTTPEHRLDIMKDSRIGTFGVLSLVTVLAAKGVALTTIDPFSAARVLVAAHATARFSCVVAMWLLPYVREPAQSKFGALQSGVTTVETAVALVLAFGISSLVLQPATFALGFMAGLAGACVIGLLAKRRIGGVTGDVLGAVEQVSETLFIIAAAAVIAGPG